MEEKVLTKIINLIKESYKESKNIKRFINNRKYKIDISIFYPDVINHRWILIAENNHKENQSDIKFNYIEINLEKGLYMFDEKLNNLLSENDLHKIAENLKIDKIKVL